MKLQCDETLSNFAFNSNLRRYNELLKDALDSTRLELEEQLAALRSEHAEVMGEVGGRGLHSSTSFQLDLSRF